MKPLSRTIIDFSQNTALSEIPQSAVFIQKLSLLDWFAVAIAGTGEPASQKIRQMLSADSGTPEATVIGQSIRLPARAAALANGTTAHALDYDDTHFLHIGHPSVTIFPAALAMAQRQGATGREFLQAALTGYEASCRIGHWLGRSHYEAGFHMTATAGTFGATLAACRLSGLTQEQTAHALGLATTRASGLKAQFGSMGKPFNAGMAAANGVEAALLAGLGFSSNTDETLGSFASSHAGACTDPETVLNGLGQQFVLEQVQHKLHACCHGLHAMLEALNIVLRDQKIDRKSLTKLEIQVHPRWLSVCNKQDPKTGLEAKFSYRQTAAMALSGIDTAALENYNSTLCADPDIAALREKIIVTGSAEQPDTAAIVSLTTTGNPPLICHFDLATDRSAAERQARLLHKAEALIGPDRTGNIWAEIERLETMNSLADLLHTAARN